MPALGAIVVAMWLVLVGISTAWTSGPGDLVGGFLLGLAGIAFLCTLYPVRPREAPDLSCDAEALRFRLQGNGSGVLPWIVAIGSTVAVAIGAWVARALPADAVAATVTVLGAGLLAVLGRVGPSVEVALDAHHLSIRRGWLKLGRPRRLRWEEVGCAVVSPADRPADAELLVTGAEGSLISTGLCAPPEELQPFVAEIEAQIERRRTTDAEGGHRERVATERAAMERLLAASARRARG